MRRISTRDAEGQEVDREPGKDSPGAARRLALAGFLATAVAFGPARNGYGLFLPGDKGRLRALDRAVGTHRQRALRGLPLGPLGGGSSRYAGGAAPGSLLVGLASAALGMALVALASNVYVLAAGVVLAGTSAGWSWAPYNDAIDHMVPEGRRGRALSVVSTGTTFGILAAGLAALWVGSDWRLAWVLFASSAVAAAVPNALVLPGGVRRDASGDTVDGSGGDAGSGFYPFRPGWGWFFRSETAPLFVVALSFGIVTAFYFSFAVDLVVRSGGLSGAAAGPLLFAIVGAAGFVGLLTGDAVSRYGLGRVLLVTLVFLCIAVSLLGVAPASSPAVVASAALFGAGVMLMSALLSVWSSIEFPERPSTGFSATLFVFGVGLTVGPASLAALAGPLGLRASFLLSAVVIALTAAARPRPGGDREQGG